MIKILYVKEDNTAYGVVSGELRKVSDSYETLADQAKEDVFGMLDGDSNADLKALKELGKFKILAYVTDENAVGIEKPAEAAGVWKAIEEDGEGTYIPRCRIRGTLENKIVRSKALLPFPDSVYSIINVSLDSSDTDDHPAYALVTDDLEHYKTYNFATKTWDGVDINSEDVAKNAFEMMKNGIRTSKISSIPEDDWKRLGARRIAFAYCISGGDTEIWKLLVKVRMVGRWTEAANEQDYTAGYTSPTTLNITFLTDGSYKVNYLEADGEPKSKQMPIGLENVDKNTWRYVDARGGAF